jgi:hypothetical protein
MCIKLGTKIEFFPVFALAISVVCIGIVFNIACTTSELYTQEFLNQDIEIDWSGVQLIEKEYMIGFDTFAFAAVSRIEGEFFIHGEFNSGLPVTLINKSGYPSHNGFTEDQGIYQCESGIINDFIYTKLDVLEWIPDSSSSSGHDFIFAIVGEFEDYEVVPIWSWQGGSRNIAEQASTLAFNNSQYSRGLPPLLERCVNPDVFRFFSGEDSGIMVCFEGTGSISTDVLLRTYVVVINNNAFIVDVSIATAPMLFRVNGELFIAAEYSGYHNGMHGQFIIQLDADGKSWGNSDWSM